MRQAPRFGTALQKKYSNNSYEICVGDEPFDDGTEATVLFFEVK